MWFLLWIAFVLLLLALPLGYGWGYRGWGAPYPRYYRRRRAMGDIADEDDWQVLADILWVFLIIAVVWLVVGLLV